MTGPNNISLQGYQPVYHYYQEGYLAISITFATHFVIPDNLEA